MINPIFDWGDEFDAYLNSLNDKDEAKMRAMIDRIEKSSLIDSIKKERVKQLDGDIYEIRARTSEHWLRGCYFQVKGTEYYITHGFNKKTNRTPKKEITKAKGIKDRVFIRLKRGGK